MKKTMGKRLLSGATSALLAVTYGLPSGMALSAKADSTATDGLPIMDQPYEESMWFRNNPLGVAGDFHLFAFDQITTRQHINGNVAAPKLVVAHEGGLPASPNQDMGRLLSVVSEEIDWTDVAPTMLDWRTGSNPDDLSLNHLTDFMFPQSYEIWGNDTPERQQWQGMPPAPVTIPANTRVQVPYPTNLMDDNNPKYTGVNVFYGKKSDYENGTIDHYMKLRSEKRDDAYIGHTSDDFINFSALKSHYEKMSEDYSKMNSTVDIIDDKIELAPSGTNVLNLKADELGALPNKVDVTGINLVDGAYKDDQVFIVNIDLQGQPEVEFHPAWTFYAIDGTVQKLDEESATYGGTNIL